MARNGIHDLIHPFVGLVVGVIDAARIPMRDQSHLKVSEVPIRWHTLAGALWLPIGVEGLTQTMMWGDGYGLSRPDLYVTSLMDAHRGWRQRAAPRRPRATPAAP